MTITETDALSEQQATPAPADTPFETPEAEAAGAGGTRGPRGPRGPRVPRTRKRAARAYRVPAARPSTPQPRDGRWWFGVIWAITTSVVIGIVLHLTLISGMQHSRAQALAFGELRTALAKAEAPVSPLDHEGRPYPHGTPVALLEIPSIGLREVIFEGTDSDTLRKGPGHRRDSVIPGQQGTSTVFGRQSTYGAPFSRLGELKIGDEITVWTGQGEQTFEVFGLRRDGDPLPAAAEAGSGRLQLVTANGFALFPSGGLYLDAQLTSETMETPGRVMTEPSLPDSEVALGFDLARVGNFLVMVGLLGLAIYAVVVIQRRSGRWQAWVIGLPVVVTLTMLTADSAASVLPNLI